jgi:hypothetical protein
LTDLGINHFGDIDYYGGFIWAPLEKPAEVLSIPGFPDIVLSPARSYIGVFEPLNLNLVGLTEVTDDQGPKVGWLAIDPWTGFLYGSPGIVAADIYRYEINLAPLQGDTPDVDQALHRATPFSSKRRTTAMAMRLAATAFRTSRW